jgi:hypothetical protein
MFQWLKNIFRKHDRNEASQPQSFKMASDEGYEYFSDVVDGCRFFATLQIRTPLSALTRAGETFNGPPSEAPVYCTPEHGIWLLDAPDVLGMGETECASDIGPVKPSQYLPFLKAFRQIVESELDHQTKLTQLNALSTASKRYEEIWKILERNYDNFPHSFFYRELQVLPGVGLKTARVIYEAGFTSMDKVREATDAQLQELPGVGKGLIGKIRDYFAKQ